MKTLFKVIAQKEPFNVQKQDGTSISKCTIILQEIGGQFENSYACTMLGNSAECKYATNELVWASLRFTSREFQGQFYQDVLVQEICSIR